ncbi:MAG: cytochrome-c peroxidase [Gammaproteobacteria bacterium]|nr:cytochrome-c peroxidase [Gammaproteobacteria bacterium]MDH3372703.1 cytochrome-c peroxidase [Gammaproteobacteria bacterium]
MSTIEAKTRVVIASLVVIAVVLAAAGLLQYRSANPQPWTEAEVAILRSLWIGSLPPLPADPTNAVADNPTAAEFGHRLFFDPRLSGTGGISCSTCHQPIRRFTDGLAKGQAIGTSKRNTRSIVGVAYSPWLYWDGRRDSLWSQALSPLEDPVEHGGNREQYAQFVAADPTYRASYESVFGEFPNLAKGDAVSRVFSNIGKAIAAYERLLLPGPSRFDAYVDAVMAGDVAAQRSAFSADEINGLRLFIGEAACTQCHNGPLFTNHEFHNTGVLAFPGEVPDKGRVLGAREVLSDPFNCLGNYSDDVDKNCAELEFARTGPELIGAMRTPSLRNLENTGPFMHKGQLTSLAEVLRHYNDAPPSMIGHSEAKPLQLNKRELRQLEAFLETLAAPLATAEKWLAPPATNVATNTNEE